ncbi:ice-binding family protein [Plantibacter sp. ME-Dv--P-095]|uniref:ice-binding family protein n=1 Tax=Plantibacter sp. ME-Dv--P-095 TaxID=3040299 RepID=UPI00254DAA3C|nr:ice-binding family protein [Plantibacter sp. ME-Dv--P-095]
MRLELSPPAHSARPGRTRPRLLAAAAIVTVGLLAIGTAPANAATGIDGPIFLGTAADYGVLASSTITNTGATTINGDLGLSPGSAVTGFPPGLVNGTQNVTNEPAALAKNDLLKAMGVASSLTPAPQQVGDLTDLNLSPGVYAGGEISLTGNVTLTGTAESVWVFQAASTLKTATGSSVTLVGGASACNVFWRVGSEATLNGGAPFVGTILADTSISTGAGTVVEGRLLASTGAVTLINTVITRPADCDDGSGSEVTTSPEITSAPLPGGTVGTTYDSTVTSTGSPDATYTVTSGALPPGLVLDSVTGTVSGTPTTPGSYPVTVTASNGTAPDDSIESTIVIQPLVPPVVVPPVVTPPVVTPVIPPVSPPVNAQPNIPTVPVSDIDRLAETGVNGTLIVAIGASLLLLGILAAVGSVVLRRRRAMNS